MTDTKRAWIDELEIDDANVKWNWSNFAGRAMGYDNEGNHNFTVILPEEEALQLREVGWAIKDYPAMEEGDPPEYTLKCKISYEKTPPRVFFIKKNADGVERKMAIDDPRDLADIRRDSCTRIDVILTPSFWSEGPRSGITAYVKEMYAHVKQSRFRERYEDLEEI